MKESKLITIVVPIYNMQEYLKRCVDSIISQTYSNIEILLIDDGSTDKSKEICDEYSKIDNRIRVFHKENGGLSDAKNYGINKANGEYIGFVDSDDWIEPQMYEKLYAEIVNENADIVICGRFLDYEDGRTVRWYNDSRMVMNTREALINLNSFKNFDMSSCDKLFKTKLYKGIEFPYGKKCEDAYVTYKLFSKSNKVVYIPECYYHYFQRNGSISRNTTINMDYIYAAEEQLKFFAKNYPELQNVAITNYAFAIKACYQTAIQKKFKLPTEYEKYRKDKKKCVKNVFKNKFVNKKKKIIYFIFAYFTIIYKILIKTKKGT